MKSLLSQLESSYQPEQLIAQDSQQAITAGELLTCCNRLANELISRNIKVLALHGDNSVNWLLIDLACQRASVCLIPLPTFFSAEQLQYVFRSLSIDAILCEQPDLFLLLLNNENITRNSISVENYHLLRIETQCHDTQLPEQTQKITFTSGSTGQPKGVCLSSAQLILQAQGLSKAIQLNNQRHLCLLPLTTLLENVAGLYMTLLSGGEVIVPSLSDIGFSGSSSLDENKFIRIISKYKPNTIILTPQLLKILVLAIKKSWKPPSSLQFIAVGGALVSCNLLAQAHDLGLPVYEGYGLSECASVVSVNTFNHSNDGSCGKPLPHLTIEFEDGEIIVSGNTMLGYVGKPESWGRQRIHTGDLGHLDGKGYLFVDGRKNHMLVSSFGRNINPEWVESEFLAHESIAECVVFGEAQPYCVALISPRCSSQSDDALQEIIDTKNDFLPDYARIKKWRRLPQSLRAQQSLMTENGRPKRRAIADYYAKMINSLYPNNMMEQKL